MIHTGKTHLTIDASAFEFLVERPYPPFWGSVMLKGIIDPHVNDGLMKKTVVETGIIVCSGRWYYTASYLHNVAEELFASWQDEAYFFAAKELLLEKEKDLILSYSEDLKSICKAIYSYMANLNVAYPPGKLFEAQIEALLKEKLSAQQAQELLSSISIPLQHNTHKQEQIDLICATDIAEHVKRYSHIYSRYGKLVYYTIKEARTLQKKLIEESFIEKVEREEKALRRAIAEAKMLLGKKAYLIDILQFLVFYRTQRTDMINLSFLRAAPLVKELARTQGISYEEALYCTDEELFGNIPPLGVIRERMDACTYMIDNGRLSCLSGKEHWQIRELLEKNEGTHQELLGRSACAGRAIGSAKIIRSPEDHKKIELGDILIASMTTPDMVPVMQLAAAFVTDEGGVTCHAAIISREMKKPCVIGTKHATKVFKDGDKVEVDANKGVVKKIQ